MKAERQTLGPLINAEELYYYLSYFARVCVSREQAGEGVVGGGTMSGLFHAARTYTHGEGGGRWRWQGSEMEAYTYRGCAFLLHPKT